ncbi:methyltransferase domain-containing protein [Allokutzneria sp. A3M-2-11 16]|uniref:SAM-dependent methyltransferase n=1 Tax=Allokutzneria sp. A3M-2-11 16 TaxID=2962043 RepID=UPI0020B7E63F|nr:class I SAM-dependent methyltransferase [Allokutzneria sp. A3M-2-11 16]MCP3803593.1 methyltransferase domain-containing protein [Allokutzneria sp. A3M-2-11 16]
MSTQPAGFGPVFDATRRHFVHWTPPLWGPLGAATTEVSAPLPGERVLDVCCGAGSSALPAAAKVGPTGAVVGVDLSTSLLDHARTVAAEQGLANVEFVEADITQYSADEPYDVVQSVFGVFFLQPDMNGAVARLLELLRPGGRFAATVWARDSVAAVGGAIFDAVRELRPNLPTTSPVTESAKGLDTESKLRSWLESFGLTDVEVTEIPLRVPLPAEEAWSFVLGTGLHALILGLSDDERERARARYLEFLAERGITEVKADALVGLGRRA